MSYAELGRDALDYQPCQYPGSPMTFRGPKCDLEEPYILCLGGSETFGKFSNDPFPGRLGDRLGRRVVNMGATMEVSPEVLTVVDEAAILVVDSVVVHIHI